MHCKDVSVRDVDIGLTKENIDLLMKDWKAYKRAEFIVLKNGDDYATLHIEKDDSKDLFSKVSGYEILSLPEGTDYVEDPSIDVLNMPTLASIQDAHPNKTVVIKGMFSHVVFIKDIVPLRLKVIDNVPPSPSKLGVLVDKALATDLIDLPIIVEKEDIDMGKMEPQVTTEAVMFPCKVSGLSSNRPYYFLDEAPTLKHDVTLIGCHLSERIFRSLYNCDVPFINVCPADFTEGKGKCIVKCCKVKEGHIIDGDVVKVPWGTTIPEVIDAIRSLFLDE
ncbi:MAG: hypothetical protein SPC89_06605 [Candidatus Methanarcanum hacksteinii]|nr:hypothetical protein [Candidatus Methanarcanum hacksteinii]